MEKWKLKTQEGVSVFLMHFRRVFLGVLASCFPVFLFAWMPNQFGASTALSYCRTIFWCQREWCLACVHLHLYWLVFWDLVHACIPAVGVDDDYTSFSLRDVEFRPSRCKYNLIVSIKRAN